MKYITYQQYVEYLQNNQYVGLRETEEKYNIEPYDDEKVKKIDKKHDKMIKKILSRKKETVKFINEFLNLQEKIEEKQIEQCSSEFITNQYESKQSDIIYKIKNKPIYFLIEHQSTIDEDMAFRIWEYVGEIMRKEVKNQSTYSNKIYPIVIPIVIYTGYRKWNAKTKFAEKQYQTVNFKQYENNLEYNLITVQDYTFEKLIEKKSLFASFMIIEKCQTEEELVQQIEQIIEIIKEPEEREILSEIIENVVVADIGKEKAREMIEKIKEREEKGMSPLTKMLFDIEIRGIRKGEIQGRKEGRKARNYECS